MESRRTKARRIQKAVQERLQVIQQQAEQETPQIIQQQAEQESPQIIQQREEIAQLAPREVHHQEQEQLLIDCRTSLSPSPEVLQEVPEFDSFNSFSDSFNSLAKPAKNVCSSLDLESEIRKWALRHNTTRVALNELLMVLNSFVPGVSLPSDSRTLLKTPRSVQLTSIGGGQIYHFGIRKHLENCVKTGLCSVRLPDLEHLKGLQNLITITVGIDGLPISRSSRKQFWPILGYVDQAKEQKVFVISMYYGNEVKPNNLAEFLKFFVDEVIELEKGFTVNGENFNFRVRCLIADAPARSFIKAIKAHNGYYGCERCYRKGKHSRGRLLYNFREEEILYSDHSFATHLYPKHHIEGEDTPLLKLKLGIISQIPAGYMHLCCLGIMKKLLLMWKDGPLPHKILPRIAKQMSERLQQIRGFTPKEFNRRPRGLEDLKNWKATEFRTFMLYVGPVVLADILKPEFFQHFMLFHTAMYILISKAALKKSWLELAERLLSQFNQSFSTVYSKDCMVYNVHMIKHLCNDVKIHGPLDRISAFPFENHMQVIKRLLRKKNMYLSQIVKRTLEREYLAETFCLSKSSSIVLAKLGKDNCYLTVDKKILLDSMENNSFLSEVF